MTELPLFYTFHFYLFGVISVASAIIFVTRQSPVAAVLWLVVTMFSLAAMYIMLNAQFIGAIQVLVYAGAIMVVFLFVIMLLNLGHASEAGTRGLWGRIGAIGIGVALVAQLLVLARSQLPAGLLPAAASAADPEQEGIVGPIATVMFSEHLLAFELTAVLLLIAIVAAVVLAKRGG